VSDEAKVERAIRVNEWLEHPITQDLLQIVMRAAAVSREAALHTCSEEAKGATLAYRTVIDEHIGEALFEPDQGSFLEEAPAVPEDALAAKRMANV